MPALTRSAIGRTALFAQFSARRWQLSPELTLTEMRTFAASPFFDKLLHNLVYGQEQQGALKHSIEHPLVIGWGATTMYACRASQKGLVSCFPMPNCTGSRKAVIFRSGTCRKKQRG